MWFFKFTQKQYFPTRCYYYLGEICDLVHEIKYGRGKIRASDGTLWTVTGSDCDMSAKVEVVEVVGTMLFRVRIIY